MSCTCLNKSSCNCGCCNRDKNLSNKTITVPVEGESAYEAWKTYNPDSDLTEEEWLEEYVKFNLEYTEDEL